MEKGIIYILHGDDAVREFQENGSKGCIKKGFNDVTKIEFDEQSNVEDFVREILMATSGSLDSCLVAEEDFEAIMEAFRA